MTRKLLNRKDSSRSTSPLAGLDAEALYERCASQLTTEIRSGALAAGTRMPSERVLAELIGYTRLTVRRALFVLAEGGLLERAPRRGWQIRTAPLSEPPNTLMGFTEMAQARGLVASARILKLVSRGATVDEADRLRIAPGADVTEVVRLRMLNGEPIAIEELCLPARRITWPAGFDFTQSVHAALDSQGVVPARGDALIDVVEATREEAALLGVPPSRGLLRLHCLTLTADGTPISLDTVRYHPDRYRFRATLERHLAAKRP